MRRIPLSLALILVLASCGYSETDLDQAAADAAAIAYSDGFVDGNSAGYDRGWAEGRERGDEDGYERGRSEGRAAGYEDGYSDGEKDGYENGYDDGYDEGERDGFDEGYFAACEDYDLGC